ncbi:ribonuclease J [Lachnospiraceae bacterium NE2001]|nr:ribonuclease J [Lachnospiraceae bacterium NE2001]
MENENKHETVKIIPLGGLEQIGMNITAIEYGDDIIVIDGGLAFPDDDMLGVDLVIPDVTYLKENASKIRGMVVTHGHEDHIGAIPYIEKEINIPIYTTKLTMGLIDYKLTEHGLIDNIRRKVVTYGQIINLGIFRIEFIRTNHSIADSCALAIYTPAGIIVHTGDFKVDFTPVFGGVIDLQRFGELGKKGVLALMADSTNVERPGYTPSEKTVGKTFDHIFDDNRDHRLIIATFASNVDRVQQIINSAYKYGRKVVVDGRSMVNVINIASELGYISIPDNTLIDIDEAKNYPNEKLVYITTGSQGENMAVLARIANSVHNKISLIPGDVVIFSSSPIPGNEKSVYRVMNELEQKGARVIYHDTHVSGHACQEELKLIYALTKPKYAIPVHGEYRHLKRHSELAQEMGIPKENVKIIRCGDVLEVGDDTFNVVGKVPAHGVFVDGLGVGDVGNIVIRDRQHLSENGLMVVAITIESGSNMILSGPDIVSRGFVYVREAELLIEQCKDVVSETLSYCLTGDTIEWNRIKNCIKEDLGEFLWQRTKRNPMILPIISEV